MSGPAFAAKVLVIAQQGSKLHSLVMPLAFAGLRAEVLADPARAVVAAGTLLPELVVVDAACTLPWRGIVGALHREPQTRTMPVAVYSADPAFDVLGALVTGARDVLAGAVDDALAARIQDLATSLSLRVPVSGMPGADAAFRLLEYAARTRFTGRLVQTGSREGSATFAGGSLVSAVFGGASGQMALVEMLALPQGGAYLTTGDAAAPSPPPTLILGEVDELVLEPPMEMLELAEPLAQERILIVDDDEASLGLVGAKLSNEGFEIRMATDGAEALAAVREWRPDAIVSDLEMPRLDGWGLLRAVRSDARIAETPLVFLSAAEHFRESLRAGAAGAQAYISKTDIKTIAQHVHEVLAPRRRFAEALAAGTAASRVELIGSRWALEKAASVIPSGTVRVRNAWGSLSIQFERGEVCGAVALRQEKVVASGLTAAQGYVSLRGGELIATKGPVSELPVGSVRDVLETAAEENLAREQAILDRSLAAGRLKIDAAAAALYVRHGPLIGRSLLERLSKGAPPRELLVSGPESAADLEEALRDLVRRGVVRVG